MCVADPAYSGVGLCALYLIWSDGPNPIERLYLAARSALAIYGRILRRCGGAAAVGGALYDDNG